MIKTFKQLTLTKQWVATTLITILPLVVAISYAGWSLAEQTKSQRNLVDTIARLNRIDAGLSDQLTEFHRSGRQFLLIPTPKFHSLVEQDITQLQTYLPELRAAIPNSKASMLLQQLIRHATEVSELLDNFKLGDNNQHVIASLKDSKKKMSELSAEIDLQIQKLLSASDDKFRNISNHLLVIGALAIPGTILLVLFSSVAVVRPLWRMADAIQNLGHGKWEQKISIEGPADLQALGKNLEWMREQLLTSERHKQAFLMHMTHELKTPLAAITEAGSLLDDEVPGDVNTAQRRVLHILLSNAENLHQLIQQLLNYNAVAHGIIRVDTQVNIQELCERIKNKLQGASTAKQLSWSIEAPNNPVPTDPTAIDMILSNLLSNAQTFTPLGGHINVQCAIESDYWWISIEDDGPGMSEEECNSIYQPFYQGKAKRTGPLKGSGMGLAIVKECVNQLKGSINLNTALGTGCRFTVRLPLNPAGTKGGIARV